MNGQPEKPITIDGSECLPFANMLNREERHADAQGLLMDMREAVAEFAEVPLKGGIYLILPEEGAVVGGLVGSPLDLLAAIETVHQSLLRQLGREASL